MAVDRRHLVPGAATQVPSRFPFVFYQHPDRKSIDYLEGFVFGLNLARQLAGPAIPPDERRYLEEHERSHLGELRARDVIYPPRGRRQRIPAQ
jgi:hypothetical protein